MRKRELWSWIGSILICAVMILVSVFVSKQFYIWVVTSELPDWVKWLLLN